jgi:hypothetical protein
MARYRLMSAVVVNIAGGKWIPPGTIVTEGVEVPLPFLPNGACEPLDADATNKFWAAGPFQLAIDPFVAAPATYFAPVAGTASPNRIYQLLGLGLALPAKLGGS